MILNYLIIEKWLINFKWLNNNTKLTFEFNGCWLPYVCNSKFQVDHSLKLGNTDDRWR